MGLSKLARTNSRSPAPDGPALQQVAFRLSKTSSGKPVRQLTIGNRLQPLVRRFGPFAHMVSKGRSHPPLKVMRWRISKSLEARNWLALKYGTCELRLRKPEPLSMLCDQV